MTCFQIALLLPLVLTGRTTGVSAVNDQPTASSQERIVLPLARWETLHRTSAFQSRIGDDADRLNADVFSPYDMYYAKGATKTDIHPLSIGARLSRCVERYTSQIASYGKTAVVCASQYWKETLAFVREREMDLATGEGAGLDDTAESGATPAPQAVRCESVERLYVTTCEYSDVTSLTTLGKVTADYRRGPSRYATLLGEFYRIDEESCPAFVANGDFAALSQARGEEADQEENDRGVEGESPTLADTNSRIAASAATWMERWATLWLGDWDVVFRNISRQIARLDWTVLLTGRAWGLAVRSTGPASESVER
jgi:hypothetical protein